MFGLAIVAGLLFGYVVYEAVKPTVPDVPQQLPEDQGFSVKTFLNPDYSIPVVYGEARLEGNVVFYNVTGPDNKYLDIVAVVCEGEIEGFTNVYINEDSIPLFENGGDILPSSSSVETSVNTTHPIYGARKASATLSYPLVGIFGAKINYDQFSESDRTLDFNGTEVVIGTDVAIGATAQDTWQNLVTYLNNSADPNISVATYTYVESPLSMEIEYDTNGDAGNSYYVYYHTENIVSGGWSHEETLYLSGGSDAIYTVAYFYNGTDNLPHDF